MFPFVFIVARERARARSLAGEETCDRRRAVLYTYSGHIAFPYQFSPEPIGNPCNEREITNADLRAFNQVRTAKYVIRLLLRASVVLLLCVSACTRVPSSAE